MAYRKKTLRTMSPVARKVARLIGELGSVERRFKNILEEIKQLEFDARALRNAKERGAVIDPGDTRFRPTERGAG